MSPECHPAKTLPAPVQQGRDDRRRASYGDEGALTRTDKDGIRYFPNSQHRVWCDHSEPSGLCQADSSTEAVTCFSGRGNERSATSSQNLQIPKLIRLRGIVPTPKIFFAYIDTHFFIPGSCLARPVLLMATASFHRWPVPLTHQAAFAGDHYQALEPIVLIQRYDHDGYVAESIGTNHAGSIAIGVAILRRSWAATRQKAGVGVLAGALLRQLRHR